MKYSIIIPVFNEAASIPQLHDELSVAINEVIASGNKRKKSASTNQYEIIFVDDGSTDGTTRLLRKLVMEDSHCRLIRFNRNHGKAVAYTAGFDAAAGRYILTLDSDLQDVPSEIPKILTKLVEDEFDLVVGWKSNRFENEPMKALPSKIFNWLKGLLFRLSLHDSNSGFRAMRREVAESLNLHGGQYRFIPEIAQLSGFKVGEAPVHHRARLYGNSKYGPMRFWTGLLDMFSVWFMTAFIRRP